jgi:hypothetical protein
MEEPMAAIEELGIAYCDDDWPHGLSCAECQHVLQEGERYTALLYAFSEDVPMCLVVCLACAT